ncbi:cytochrome P450 monooxygenase pc-bph [Cytidiella melzeri]|nr:cytochrome P450 monooxygenase pc-bph [Cytidiella melzeri]
MTLTSFIASILNSYYIPISVSLILVATSTHVIPRYPGSLIASISDAWMGWIPSQGKKINIAVHEAHAKHGKFVRITPNHVSIADASAPLDGYGHGVGQGMPTKSDFYSAFGQFPGIGTISTTRSREVHARKRKLIARTFSLKSVVQFEPVVRKCNCLLMQHWDRMCAAAVKGQSSVVGDRSWRAKDGYAFVDCLAWFNYQVFDIVSNLIFDGPFGMTSSASDSVQMVRSRTAAIDAYGLEEKVLEYDTIPAVKTISDRSKYAISIGVLPLWWRPLVKKLPWFRTKRQAMDNIATLTVTAVGRRLKSTDVKSSNILSKGLESTDEHGDHMGNIELSAEAMTLMVAGTDTTSSAALTYFLSRNQGAQKKLQHELDDGLGPPTADSLEDADFSTGSYDQLKNLPYLQDAINAGLRLYSTVGIGLPRVVTEGGMTICREKFAPGTVVSVPIYTVHRDKAIWGDDADEYFPERWSRGDRVAMQKAFAPLLSWPAVTYPVFSSCVGRNTTSMEMTIFLGKLFHRYQFTMATPDYEASRVC